MKSSVPAAPLNAKILYVEDDIDLQKSVSFILWKEGFQILGAETGADAIELAKQGRPDLILLDLLLPDMDGTKLCSILKKDPATADIAIIMVTARKQVKDVVAGLKDFADDYITIPFEPEILLARIRALLRRRIKAGEQRTSIIKVDDLVIHPDAYEVFISGKRASLSKTEFDILAVLAGTPNQVFTRSRILDCVREDGYPATERVVDYHITGLRKKMGKARKYIQTVRGVGYKFDARDNI